MKDNLILAYSKYGLEHVKKYIWKHEEGEASFKVIDMHSDGYETWVTYKWTDLTHFSTLNIKSFSEYYSYQKIDEEEEDLVTKIDSLLKIIQHD